MAQAVKPADVGVSVGQVLLGKYRVDSILGSGGMGVVAECTHLGLNERRAIKMLRQDVLLDTDAVQRFKREAQAAAKLKSEYVAKVLDVGDFEDGTPYMAMEFLEGNDLGEHLKKHGVLSVQWAVELVLQTAEALAEAHSLGIVHRDIKPTNLFVTWRPDGSALVKVLDFGISKSPMGTDMQLTQTQSLLGTPAYMSPEQMRSARMVDSRTDIWSLGTVFYEAIEGHRPFEAESFSEMCVKVAVDPPAQMVNTPPQLQGVIMRCLAKSPEQRYANMAELARDLVPFAIDPHQAQVLVERMVRVLRRSSPGDFSGDTSSSASIPRVVRDIDSAPVQQIRRPSHWSVGSDPVGVPWHSSSDPALTPYRTLTPAEGVAVGAMTQAHLQTQPVGKRRKRWPYLLLGFLVAAGVGGTIAWQQTQGQANDEAAVTKVEPPAPGAQQATAPTPPPPSEAAAPKPAAEATPPPAPAKQEPPPPAPSIDTPKPHPAVAKEHASHPPVVKAAATKATPKETAKETPKETPKETAKAVEVKETKPAIPPGLNCDPTAYSSMRNYPAACPH